MSTITFTALINDIHYDLKKGTLKIQLLADNYVSLDTPATLGPHDETVQVTLEITPTKISDVGEPRGERGTAWLKEAARKLGEFEEDEDPKEAERILMKTPLFGASGEGEK